YIYKTQKSKKPQKGVGFIVPGNVIFSKSGNDKQGQLLFVQDILYDDFEPSPLPKDGENMKQWHKRVTEQGLLWQNSEDQKDRYPIKPLCHMKCVKMNINEIIPSDEKSIMSIEANFSFDDTIPSTDEWWGEGTTIIEWNPNSNDFDWMAMRINCNEEWFETTPICDSWIHKERIPLVKCNYIQNKHTKEKLLLKKWLPAITFYRRPYFEIKNGKHLSDESPLGCISLDFFFDGFHFTVGTTGQVLQPRGGYWTIVDMIGNKELVFEWAMVPDHMHHYSFGAVFEKQLLKLTFDGLESRMWNPFTNRFDSSIIYIIPIKFTGDLPEVGKWTGFAVKGLKESRYGSIHFNDEDDLNSHGCWKKNAWFSAKIVQSNVE
ncbi:MAG: hypothetical protein GY714_23275, partial [Desulfobacterales bacterium]|nr:hypothetical protein [Desulfobacterales bacterium]